MAAAQRLMAHDALTHIHACHMRLTHSFGKNEIESIRQQQHPDTPTHTNRHPATGRASASSSGNVGGGGGMTHSEAGGHAMVLVSDQVQREILAGGAAGVGNSTGASRRRGASAAAATTGGLLILDGSASADAGAAAGSALDPRPGSQLAVGATSATGPMAARVAVEEGRAADFQRLLAADRYAHMPSYGISQVS